MARAAVVRIAGEQPRRRDDQLAKADSAETVSNADQDAKRHQSTRRSAKPGMRPAHPAGSRPQDAGWCRGGPGHVESELSMLLISASITARMFAQRNPFGSNARCNMRPSASAINTEARAFARRSVAHGASRTLRRDASGGELINQLAVRQPAQEQPPEQGERDQATLKQHDHAGEVLILKCADAPQAWRDLAVVGEEHGVRPDKRERKQRVRGSDGEDVEHFRAGSEPARTGHASQGTARSYSGISMRLASSRR